MAAVDKRGYWMIMSPVEPMVVIAVDQVVEMVVDLRRETVVQP